MVKLAHHFPELVAVIFFWGSSAVTEVRDPTTNNRAYYYVFEATLKSSANVNIVDTIVI